MFWGEPLYYTHIDYEISMAMQSSNVSFVVACPLYWKVCVTQGGRDVIGSA
jgi:hypothetical protein